jgi:hypothetical protein
MVADFIISATSDRFWNKDEFVIFCAQNLHKKIRLRIVPEAISLAELGVYKLLEAFGIEHAEIITRNPLEHHDRYQITLVQNQWLEQSVEIDSSLHTWNSRKLFMALFGRPTAARLTIGSYLLKNHAEQSHLHFSAETSVDNLLHFELDKSLDYDRSSIARIGELISKLPILLASSERRSTHQGYDYDDPLTGFYRDILVDVVVESHVLGHAFFPTEKTLRSIYLKKPFVVFSNFNFLAYLRQMGFRTFQGYWDENYDGFETTNRLHKIYQVLDYLAALDPVELKSMYEDMRSILDHNFDLLKERNFSRKIKKIG